MAKHERNGAESHEHTRSVERSSESRSETLDSFLKLAMFKTRAEVSAGAISLESPEGFEVFMQNMLKLAEALGLISNTLHETAETTSLAMREHTSPIIRGVGERVVMRTKETAGAANTQADKIKKGFLQKIADGTGYVISNSVSGAYKGTKTVVRDTVTGTLSGGYEAIKKVGKDSLAGLGMAATAAGKGISNLWKRWRSSNSEAVVAIPEPALDYEVSMAERAPNEEL